MITRSPIYNVVRSLTSSQYEFIEREFGYSKTSFLDLPDETLVDIYYDLCDIEASEAAHPCVLRPHPRNVRQNPISRPAGADSHTRQISLIGLYRLALRIPNETGQHRTEMQS